MELDIFLCHQGNSMIISLSGRLTAANAPEFDRALADWSDGMEEIKIDMSNLVYISSMGIRSVLSAKRALAAKGTAFKICSPTETVMDVFNLTGLDELVDIEYSDNIRDEKLFTYPLLPIQRRILDTHFNKASSTMMNIGTTLKLDPSADLDILAKALNSVISDNDVFRCRFVLDKNSGDICQKFDGDVKPIIIEKMTSEDFKNIIGTLKEPYEIIGHRLWNIHIIETPDAKYLFMDFYHAIIDRTAIVTVFWNEVNRRYTEMINESKDTAGTHIHRSSSYAAYVAKRFCSEPEPQLIEEGKRFLGDMTDGFNTKKHLPPMDRNEESECCLKEAEFPIDVINSEFFSNNSITEQIFFLGVTMLTIAKMNRTSDSVILWINNGRNTKTEAETIGIMLEHFPIRWEFKKEQKTSDLMIGLDCMVKDSIRYRSSLDSVSEADTDSDMACFMLQKYSISRKREFPLGNGWASEIEIPEKPASGAGCYIDTELNVHDDGTFSLVIYYNNGFYSEDAVRRYAEAYSETAAALKDENCDIYGLLGL